MYQVCYWDGGKGPWKRFLASEMHVLSSEFPTVDEALAKVRERMLKLASYPVGVFPAGDTEPVVICPAAGIPHPGGPNTLGAAHPPRGRVLRPGPGGGRLMYRCMFWYANTGPWQVFMPYEWGDHELQHPFESKEDALEAIREYMADSPEQYHPVGVFLENEHGRASIPLCVVTGGGAHVSSWYPQTQMILWKEIEPRPQIVVVV